ncbi:MAG: fibronectin type III domain-containing protein, partial [Bacteroidia bacterium]|nr:fibronectin type III domain-containing protein [Bacteroidia bacterium]
YQVRYRKAGSFVEFQVTVAGNITSLNISGLEPGTTYQFRVRSLCGNVVSPLSYSYSFTTLTTPVGCIVPTSASAEQQSGGSVVIQWNPSNVLQAYEVEVRLSGSNLPGIVATVNGGSATFGGLAPGTYTATIRPLCDYNYSISTAFVVSGAPQSCLAPTSVSAQVSGGTLTVSFTPASGGAGATGFVVAVQGTGLSVTVPGTATSATLNVSSLAPGTYTATVKTLCGTNESGIASQTFVIAPPPACATPLITSLSLTSTTVTVRWPRVNGATGYVLQYRLASSQQYVNVNVAQTSENTVAQTITGLTPSTIYAVRVVSVCAGGVQSDPSIERRFKTLAGGSTRQGVELDFDKPLSSLTLYPNPTKGFCELSFIGTQEGPAVVAVYDLRGTLVYRRDVETVEGENQISLDLGDKTPGLYLVKFGQGEASQTVRLVLE